MDEITLRLEIAKPRESECNQRLQRKLDDRVNSFLVALHSILDMSTKLAWRPT